MTLSTTDNAISYTGNGTTKAFSFPYRFLSDGHLSVAVAGSAKVLNVDYSITGAGSTSGGTVTFITAPADGDCADEKHVAVTQAAASREAAERTVGHQSPEPAIRIDLAMPICGIDRPPEQSLTFLF